MFSCFGQDASAKPSAHFISCGPTAAGGTFGGQGRCEFGQRAALESSVAPELLGRSADLDFECPTSPFLNDNPEHPKKPQDFACDFHMRSLLFKKERNNDSDMICI